ncbi:MAG: hypothetical protein ACRDFT_05215, partial [bacterium]
MDDVAGPAIVDVHARLHEEFGIDHGIIQIAPPPLARTASCRGRTVFRRSGAPPGGIEDGVKKGEPHVAARCPRHTIPAARRPGP